MTDQYNLLPEKIYALDMKSITIIDNYTRICHGMYNDFSGQQGMTTEYIRADLCPPDAAARIARLEEALRGVIRVADRKTVEFDTARAALENK